MCLEGRGFIQPPVGCLLCRPEETTCLRGYTRSSPTGWQTNPSINHCKSQFTFVRLFYCIIEFLYRHLRPSESNSIHFSILLYFFPSPPTPWTLAINQISAEQIILAVNYRPTENILLRVFMFRLRFSCLRDEPWPIIGDSNMPCHSVLQALSRQIENRLIVVHQLFVYIGND